MKFMPLFAAGLALLGFAAPALAQTKTDVWTYAFNMEGEPKYPEGFTHFD